MNFTGEGRVMKAPGEEETGYGNKFNNDHKGRICREKDLESKQG